MSLGKAQAAQAPTALGSMLQASTYGATIPTVYGMTLSPLLAIWAANLRQGGSTKKFKQLKKGITAYVENIDFLVGSNPIIGINQMWINGATIPLALVTYTSSGVPNPFWGSIAVGLDPTTMTPPDPNFYSVIGVTLVQTFSVTFDDYGGTGPVTFSGSWEIPLWNELMIGPDPTHGSASKNVPFCYRWQPSYGAQIFIDSPLPLGDVKIYYTQKTNATSNQGPLLHNRLAFEPELGSGTEYADAGDIPGSSTPYTTQQIIYPMFAGVESSDIDLGSAGALPQIQAEVQGKWGLYSTGDGDFADMIEDVFKSGVAQASIGGSDTSTTRVEHGLSCYQFPGCIQIKVLADPEVLTTGPRIYNLPVTEGNFLVVMGANQGTSPNPNLTVTDTLSNTWTPLFAGGLARQAWYAQVAASGADTVSVGGLDFDWHVTMLEIAGVDTLDAIGIGNSAGQASVTTSNIAGQPGYLLSVGLYSDGSTQMPAEIPQWNVLDTANIYSTDTNIDTFTLVERTVYSPGTYSITLPVGAAVPIVSCILAFKNSVPPNYPKPVGDFIDSDSLDLVRLQCRANGLYGSLSMNQQQAASDWLETLYDAANAAPVFMGFKLYSMPYSEVSAAGNGAIYNAPTAGGPTFNLTADAPKGDFIAKSGDAPLKVKTAARVDQPNVLQMQCVNRSSNYNPSTVEQPDALGLSLFSVRKADPITNNAIQDVTIARQLLAIQVRKLQYGGDNWTFTMPAKYCLFGPMGAGGGGFDDAVITVSDSLASIFGIPVRITSISEQDDLSLDCEAEPFIYGMYAPSLTASITGTDTPTPYQPNPSAGTGGLTQINPPIIFEAVPRLSQQTSPAQLWIVTSCGAESIYGGCQCYISTDGGASYVPASAQPTVGSAMQAEVGLTPFQAWPSGTDPDTTNNLFVSFAETLPDPPGTLPSFSATQRDNFQYPCYVGFNNEATIDAEFVTGDTSQITELGVLFSDPTLLNALPSDATIINIFPMLFIEAGPSGSPVVTQLFSGTGLTPTSGGTSFEGPITGDISAAVPTGGGAGIGTSLTNQEIRYSLTLGTTGPGAFGQVTRAGWAIYYSSATPFIDPLCLVPFSPATGNGFGWAIPKTVATGQVGTGTNATVSAFGGIAPTDIPYELMSYNEATLVMGGYELMATGSGNELRRGVYGAPAPGVGMNHPQGSPFALLDPSGVGLFKINMDPAWIDTQLFFKFPTFNNFGSLVTPLSDADFYTFTPTGIPGNIGPATGGILVNGS
jgi:hypothetical protein